MSNLGVREAEPKAPTPGEAQGLRQGSDADQELTAQTAQGGVAAGTAQAEDSSVAAVDDAPPIKRMRIDMPSSPAQPAASLPFSLVAFPITPATAPPDRSLLGASVSGVVESVCDSAYWVSLRLGETTYTGALLCPPAGLMDPAAPSRRLASPLKKPRTAFNFYSDAVRPAAKDKHPRADQKGISKIVGDMWAQLPAGAREPYNEAARQDKERYEAELRDHQARFPQGSRRDLQRTLRLPASLQDKPEPPPASGSAGGWGFSRQRQALPTTAPPPPAAASPSTPRSGSVWAAPPPSAQASGLPPRHDSAPDLLKPGTPVAGDTLLDWIQSLASSYNAPSQPSSSLSASSIIYQLQQQQQQQQQQQLQQQQGHLPAAPDSQHGLARMGSQSSLHTASAPPPGSSPVAALQALLHQIEGLQQHPAQPLAPSAAQQPPSLLHSMLPMPPGSGAGDGGALNQPLHPYMAQPGADGASGSQPSGAGPSGASAAAGLSEEARTLYGRLAGLIKQQTQPPAPPKPL